MPRQMSADMLAAIQAQDMLPVLFIYAQFVTGPVYVWTGYGPVQWNGNTWQGIGTLLSVSSIEEGSDVEARGITLGLSGFDSNLLALTLGEVRQGLPVTVYLGLFYPGSPWALIPDPLISWSGLMDQPTIAADGQTAGINLACENKLVAMNVAVDRRYTNEDQARDWPGDTFFNYVPSIQDQNLYWGRDPGQTNHL